MFSKDAPNLPITETRVEYEPCMDNLYQSTSPGQHRFYSAEIQQSGCVMEKNNRLMNDPRFSESGLNTNAYNLRLDSNVYQHMMD